MEDATLKKAVVDFVVDVLIEAKARMGKVVDAHLKEVLEKERLLLERRRDQVEIASVVGPAAQGLVIPKDDELWTLEEFARLMKFPTVDAARRFVKTHLPSDCRVKGVGRRVKLVPSRVKKALGL